MSWQATECVRRLKGVNRGEKAVLYTLAAHHRWSSGLCCPRIPEIAADAEMSERHVIRLLQGLVERGVLERERPLDGRGAFTYYTFPGLGKGDKKGDIFAAERVTFATAKGDIYDSENRGNKERTEPSTPRTETLPNPPLQGGNQTRPLTARQMRELNQRILMIQNSHKDQFGHTRWEDGRELEAIPFAKALELACVQLMLPMERAWQLAMAAGHDAPKKEPGRAVG